MTCSISFFNKLLLPLLLLCLGGLVATARGEGEAAGRLRTAAIPVARPAGPQMLGSATVAWTVPGPGGVGERNYLFLLRSADGAEREVQSGTSATWQWTPAEAGPHQVRVVVSDAEGNLLQSPWSEPYGIAQPLQVEMPVPDRSAPQAAQSSAIGWSAEAVGGVGEKRYLFELAEAGGDLREFPTGTSGRWSWQPETAGSYQVRVHVQDRLGNRVRSDWSKPFRIEPPLQVEVPAALPASPQMAGTDIAWTVQAGGGVGDQRLIFEVLSGEGNPIVVQTGPQKVWTWHPQQAGRYQVRAVMRDALGNEVRSDWSDAYRIEPPLTVDPPIARPSGPQMLGSVTPIWTVSASGGVGPLNYAFTLRRPDGSQQGRPKAPSSSWQWTPEEPGPYQVQVTVTDALGNEKSSDWSARYGIAPPLQVAVPAPDRSAPQAARTFPIVWSVEAIGGVGTKRYTYILEREGGKTFQISLGTRPRWSWIPEKEGNYRIRGIVEDGLGNRIESEWSRRYRVEPPLVVQPPVAEPPAPQVADTADILWRAEGSGGVGAKRFAFEIARGAGSPVMMPSGPNPRWTWRPQEGGDYRVRVTMTDALGNLAVSPWSAPYEIAAPLVVESLQADRSSPQAARTVPITWKARVSGGVGDRTYIFELLPEGGIERPVQYGPELDWGWQPEEAGRYRVRVTVRDALGNRVQSDWSAPFEIAPPLTIEEFGPESDRGQFLRDADIDCRVAASGGVGARNFRFYLQEKGLEPVVVQEGSAPRWTWRPTEPGYYRLRVVFADALGNQVESAWTSWLEIVGPLTLKTVTPDLPAPQPAQQQGVRWTATARGGVGERRYEFRTRKQEVVVVEQVGPEPVWTWSPRKAGTYQVQVVVSDAEGNSVTGDWSPGYRIVPAIALDSQIAFLPIENLSGVEAPLAEIGNSFAGLLADSGLRLLDPAQLGAFMARYRWRNTGGISSGLSQKLRQETATDAVLITSLESYQGGTQPKISLISRLVLCSDQPRILWIDTVGLTGTDAPGLLSLGLIKDPTVLIEKAERQLLESLERYLAGEEATQRLWYIPGSEKAAGKNGPRIALKEQYRPRSYYRASRFVPTASYSLAVVPFLNEYARKNAGLALPLHMIAALHPYENLAVFEPGVVRDYLLRYRLIMPAGPSLAVADVLASPTTIDADLVLSGQVFDFQGLQGTPKIDFSVQIFDGNAREVIWWSRSYATGDEGVYFFDVGRVHSVQILAKWMTATVGALVFDGRAP